MKKLLLISAMALAVSTAYADNTATTTVTSSGKVIAALGISQGTPMKLPDLVAPDGSEGDTTVELTCDNAGAETIAYTANGSPFTHGGTGATDGVVASSLNTAVAGADSTGTCAELTVTGEADYKYLITTSGAVTALTGTAVTFGNLLCTQESGTLTGSDDKVYCGVKLTAATGSAGGYTASGDITVTYD